MIYLDHHATTPLDPRVLDAMMPYMKGDFGNPSSTHAYGVTAQRAVELAREQVAELLGARSDEIFFTSGATESNNLALRGLAIANRHKGNHLITGATEHKAVLEACRHLESEGFEVTYLQPDATGMISAQAVFEALTDRTIAVSLMHGNNEVGTLHPLPQIGALTREQGVLLHTDAAQTVGKVAIDVQAMEIDLLSVAAHKLYGPKGVGALYVRQHAPRVELSALLFGSTHERGLRPGTLNVPGIVGLGQACAIAAQEMAQEAKRTMYLRDRLLSGLRRDLDEVILNGHPTQRLPHNLHVSFPFAAGAALMRELEDKLAVSAGSACTSANPEPSHVLRAMGMPEHLALNALRFGIGRFTTEAQIDMAVQMVSEQVSRIRRESPAYSAYVEKRGIRPLANQVE